jgi:CTP:molybdopterin cytidylyltransferase MocA
VNTLRDVLADFPNLLIPVAAENILIDIDSPEDYKTLLHNNRGEADR